MNSGEETSGTDEGSKSKTPTTSKTPTAAAKSVKSEVEKANPETLRVKMVVGQAGIIWKDGKDKKGRPCKVNGGDFVRNPGLEYDVPFNEAQRLIESGAAVEAKAA